MDDARFGHDEELTDDFSDSYSSDVSSCDEESSEDQSTTSTSPRTVGHDNERQDAVPLAPLLPAGQISPKRTAKPKIPALGLRIDPGAAVRGLGSATPRTAVQQDSTRTRHSIAVPRLASARGTEDSAAARELLPNSARAPPVPKFPPQLLASRPSLPIPRERCDGQRQPEVATVTVSVGLLSSAVVFRHQQKGLKGPQLASRALTELGTALGIRQTELTLYEVREVQDPGKLSPDSTKLAVAVKNSGKTCGWCCMFLSLSVRESCRADHISRHSTDFQLCYTMCTLNRHMLSTINGQVCFHSLP
jgi:hypothetical protein